MECKTCKNDSEFNVNEGRLFCAQCGAFIGRHKATKNGHRLESVGKGRGSHLETLFAALWEQHAPKGIRQPDRQVPLIPEKPQSTCDFVWIDIRVVVEIDGGQHAPGGGRHNTDGDRWKINRLTELGYRVFRYSGEMLKNDPLSCVTQIVSAIRDSNG